MCWFSVKWRVGARPLDAIFGGKSAQPHAVARRGGGPADCNGFQEEIKLGYQLATKRIHNSSGIFNTACGPGRQAAQRVHQTVASRLRHFSTSGLRHPGAIGRSTYTRLEDLSHGLGRAPPSRTRTDIGLRQTLPTARADGTWGSVVYWTRPASSYR